MAWPNKGGGVDVIITGNKVVGGTLTATMLNGVPTSYQWYRKVGNNAAVAISGATNQTYTLVTADRNAVITCVVTGVAFSSAANLIPPSLASKPTITGITAGDGSITVTFSAPTDDGGSTITGYQLYIYRASDNVLLQTVSGANSPISYSGLTNGVAVYAKVAAVTSVGTGNLSDASSNVTPANATVSRVVNGFVLNSTI